MAKSITAKGSKSKLKSGQKKQFEFPDSLQKLHINPQPIYLRPQYESLIKGQILIIDRFFSASICNELINTVVDPVNGITMETTPLIKSKEYAARVNDRSVIIDEKTSESLWKYLKQLLLENDEYGNEDENWVQREFSRGVGLNPQLRIYRYREGQYFEKHYDESVEVKINTEEPLGRKCRTKWTLLIYLTGGDEFVGGGTIFYNIENNKKNVLNVHPNKGMALLHKHGDDCLLHEAEVVTSGYKWVLRSDVAF